MYPSKKKTKKRKKFTNLSLLTKVTATSIISLGIHYDNMPLIGLNVILIGFTTKTVKNVNGTCTLDFYIEEKIGEKEPNDYWIEVKHNPNNKYLSRKTASINQKLRSTTAILVGQIAYEPPSNDETTPEKHVLYLEDISMISTQPQKQTNPQSINIPWLNPQTNTPTKNTKKRPRTSPTKPSPKKTLSQMEATTTTSNNLAIALQSNPIPSTLPNTTLTPSTPDQTAPTDK